MTTDIDYVSWVALDQVLLSDFKLDVGKRFDVFMETFWVKDSGKVSKLLLKWE